MKISGTRSSLFIALIMLLLPIFSASASDDWEKAVRIYSENDYLHPYSLKITSETFDKDGKLEKTATQSFLLDYKNGFDNPGRKLLRATENGKDVTEKVRKELEKGNQNRGNSPGVEMEGMDKHPLEPSIQQDVFAFDTGRSEYRGGRLCSVWNFEIELNEDYRGIGTAWIDKERGAAVSLEYRIEPLFPFVERMNISMDYTADSPGRWLLEQLTMSGKVNMIIMKKSFESVMWFSDYR